MRNVLIWLAIVFFGVALGIGGAVLSLRNATFGDDIRIGPWITGQNIGTADADIRTRAVVALRGLLALPASEARYFTARTDSAGRPLDGRCTYGVRGAEIGARWWSITLYDREGWLVPNAARRHSIGSGAISRSANGNWDFVVAPMWDDAAWIDTGHPQPFDLTLRAYRPQGALRGRPPIASMPVIERMECQS